MEDRKKVHMTLVAVATVFFIIIMGSSLYRNTFYSSYEFQTMAKIIEVNAIERNKRGYQTKTYKFSVKYTVDGEVLMGDFFISEPNYESYKNLKNVSIKYSKLKPSDFVLSSVADEKHSLSDWVVEFIKSLLISLGLGYLLGMFYAQQRGWDTSKVWQS